MLIKLTNGKSMTKSRMVAGGTVPVYGANGLIGATTCPLVLEPTITIGRVGSCGEINMTSAPAWITDNAMWISNISDKINREYLYFALKGLPIAESAKIAAMPSISQNNVLSEGIPCPPLEDQVKVGIFLEEFSQGVSVENCSPLPILIQHQRRTVARIEELAAKIEEAQKLRRQAAEEAEGLAGSYAKEMFDLDGKYPKNLIEKICVVRGGIQKSSARIPGANPRRYITVAHVQRNWIDINDPRYFEVSDEELERWRLMKGDVLVIEGNGSAEQIGRTALFRGEIEDCVHQNHVIRVRPDQNEIVPEYLNAYLNSPPGQAQMRERSRTTSGLFNLSVGRIKSIEVPVPPLDEQRRIVARLDELQAQVDRLKKHQVRTAEELDALLPAVLERAFRGEL